MALTLSLTQSISGKLLRTSLQLPHNFNVQQPVPPIIIWEVSLLFHVFIINSGLKTLNSVNASQQSFNSPKSVVGNFGMKTATLSLDNGQNKNLGTCVHNLAIILQVWKEVQAQDQDWMLFLVLNAADQRWCLLETEESDDKGGSSDVITITEFNLK